MTASDPYYSRKEVSNSDLTALKMYFMAIDEARDLSQAFRFGDLVDKLLTEPDRCDHLRKQIDGEQYFNWEWNLAMAMVKSFRSDGSCNSFLKMSEGQKFFRREMEIQYGDFAFTLPCRCKYDLFFNAAGFGADIKSTVATTQAQFEQACIQFDYDRSRAFYMDISGAEKDMIIGISKKAPHRIFKIMIDRNSEIYLRGREKYQELAWKWTYLFGNIESIQSKISNQIQLT